MTLSKEAAQLVAKMKEYEPARARLAAHVARELLRAAPRAQDAHERECSDPTWQGSRAESRHETRMIMLAALVERLNDGRPADPRDRWRFEENGDPRGFPFYVHFPGRKEGNSWGGPERGFGVYCEDHDHRQARMDRARSGGRRAETPNRSSWGSGPTGTSRSFAVSA